MRAEDKGRARDEQERERERAANLMVNLSKEMLLELLFFCCTRTQLQSNQVKISPKKCEESEKVVGGRWVKRVQKLQ